MFAKLNLGFLFLPMFILACDSNGIGKSKSVSPDAGGPPCVIATLEWDKPTYGDGSPIAPGEIAGYEIHFGLAPNQYTKAHPIAGEDTLTTTISGLQTNLTYYFVAKTIAVDPAKNSVYSNEVSLTKPVCGTKTLNLTDPKTL